MAPKHAHQRETPAEREVLTGVPVQGSPIGKLDENAAGDSTDNANFVRIKKSAS
jgi:hypothetical protein